MKERVREAVDRAYASALELTGQGRVAGYIPELAKADPGRLAIAVHSVDGDAFEAGDTELPFTLQSVSKIFALALVMRREPAAWLDALPVEPSGDAFHSIVRLEEEAGRPRNPLINAGAIAVTARVPGSTARRKGHALVEFLRGIDPAPRFRIDDDVFRSEARTGERNRALAHFMAHYGHIQEPDVAVDAYFRQCAVTVSARELARLGLFLANHGTDPITGIRHATAEGARSLLAIMTMCGLYDEVGRFAVRVGLPAKSGVSGCILAVVPGTMSIAVFSPGLGPKGNSLAGIRALEVLSRELGLSLFA